MFKRLLVPLDGSRFASRALRYAMEVAHQFGTEVILLQVVESATPLATTTGMAPGMQSPTAAQIAVQAALDEEKRNTSHAKRYLSRKARDIRSQDIEVSYQVVVGDPAQSIMEFAEKENVDLVVMTTHGKSGLKRAIMGSVADQVIRESGKPVLVVRPHINGKK
jgi:nucleotide-binding universal stress UspA family protein